MDFLKEKKYLFHLAEELDDLLELGVALVADLKKILKQNIFSGKSLYLPLGIFR